MRKNADNLDLHHSRRIEADLSEGPVRHRKHTDSLCCLLYLAIIGVFISSVVYARMEGKPSRVLSFLDSDGRICGDSEGVEDYPYLYFPVVARKYIQYTVCVKECPITYEDPVDCKPTTAIPGCTKDTEIDLPDLEEKDDDTKSSRLLQMGMGGDSGSSGDSGMGMGGDSGSSGDSGMGMGGDSGSSGDTGMGGGGSPDPSSGDSGSSSTDMNSMNGNSEQAEYADGMWEQDTDGTGMMNYLTNGEMDTAPPCEDPMKCPGTVFAPTNIWLMGPPMDPGISYPPSTPKKTMKFQIYNTSLVYDKVCIPNQRRGLKQIFSDKQITQASNWVDDIRRVGPVLLLSIGISVLLGLCYSTLIRFFAGFLTWFMVFGTVVAVALAGIFFVQKAHNMEASTLARFDTFAIHRDRIIGTILCLLACIMFVYVLLKPRKIRLAIAIIKASSNFVSETRSIISVPFLSFFVLIGFTIFWFATQFWLRSIGDPVRRKGVNIPVAEIIWEDTARFYIYFLFFPLVWILSVFIHMSEFLISSATCQWYFKVQKRSLFFSYLKALWYHLGTISFASLALAVSWPLRFFVEGIVEQVQAIENSKYAYLCCCCIKFFDLFERILQYFSSHTLEHCALIGDNYINSSTSSYSLVFRHISRFSIVGGLGKLLTGVGSIFIGIVTSLIAYEFLESRAEYKTNLASPVLPTLLCFTVSFVIGSNFMAVYGESVDTILYCYSVDEEIQRENRGEIRAPEEIKEFLKENAKDAESLIAHSK